MTAKILNDSASAEEWIEATPHHKAEVVDDGLLLTGSGGAKIVIPRDVLEQIDLELGGPYDRRMFRIKSKGSAP